MCISGITLFIYLFSVAVKAVTSLQLPNQISDVGSSSNSSSNCLSGPQIIVPLLLRVH